MKRITLTMIKPIAMKYMALPALVVALFPWKWKIAIAENAVRNYCRMGEWLHGGNYLKDDRYCNSVRSLRKCIDIFIQDLGFRDPFIILRFPQLMATIFEYDDSYRYRLQDIMTEASRKAFIAHPIREAKRLIRIFNERELSPEVKKTGGAIAAIANVILLHPRIRRALRKTLASLTDKDWAWLGLDNADRYHVLFRGDYDFLGHSFEERFDILTEKHCTSKCCGTNIEVYRYPNHEKPSGSGKKIRCRKCGEDCDVIENFPPEVEIAPEGS